MKKTKGERRVTLHDIARETGYSLTAVSRALRGKSDIGSAASEKIRQAAREMGYVANQTAVALRYGRTNIITVILVNLTNPYFSVLTNHIQSAAQEMGYSLVIVCSRDDPELEMQLVEQAIARRSDGVLLFPTLGSGPAVEMLKTAGVPVVLMSSRLPSHQVDCVAADEEAGVRLAVSHLLEAGCRRLAFVASGSTAPSFNDRRDSFVQVCEEMGLAPEDHRVCVIPRMHLLTTEDLATHNELAEQLLRLREEGFAGIMAFCDAEAWRIMGAICQSGVLEAGDFSIVSFDNVDGELVSPTPLCSVDCSPRSMARQGMELLRQRIQGDDRPLQTIVSPVRMVCRRSCVRSDLQ